MRVYTTHPFDGWTLIGEPLGCGDGAGRGDGAKSANTNNRCHSFIITNYNKKFWCGCAKTNDVPGPGASLVTQQRMLAGPGQ